MITREEAERNNQLSKYWEYETPEVLTTEKNLICYYPIAKRLVVKFAYKDRKTGEQKGFKGTGLNLEALAESPAILDRLIEILSSLKGV